MSTAAEATRLFKNPKTKVSKKILTFTQLILDQCLHMGSSQSTPAAAGAAAGAAGAPAAQDDKAKGESLVKKGGDPLVPVCVSPASLYV